MKSFEYIQPKKLKEAAQINLKNKEHSLFYAGGTDLLGLMKDNVLQPEKLINLKNFRELDFIEHKADGGIRIGALTKLAAIASDEKIKKNFTALALSAAEVGTPQLRNVGTIAGNVCQRPRCFYFRGDFNCLRKGGDECFAISGNNKYHCIVGGDPCYIVHPSDTAVALTLFNAEVQIFNGTKYRTVPIKEFFVLPEKDHTKENILESGEIITEFILPPNNFNFSNFIKVKERGSWDFAVASVAVAAQKELLKISRAEFVFGGVAPIPWIDNVLNSAAKNFTGDEKVLTSLANKAFKNSDPMDMNYYKIRLAKNLVIKSLI